MSAPHPRVRLRALKVIDAPALADEANDPAVARTLRDYFPQPYSVDDALRFIEEAQSTAGPASQFVIEAGGEVAGVMGIFLGEDVLRRNAEIGYWLGRRWWGRGIATEAVTQIVHYAFAELQLQRVFAEVFGSNPASVRVLEKAGFVQEYRLPAVIVKDGEVLDLIAMGVRKTDRADTREDRP